MYDNGKLIAGTMSEDKTRILNAYEIMKKGVCKGGLSINNTTIGVVVTNANFNKLECKKVSQMARNRYAKVIFPIHTVHDRDTIFAMTTGKTEADVTLVGSLAIEVVEKSIVNAIKNAESVKNILAYKDIF